MCISWTGTSTCGQVSLKTHLQTLLLSGLNPYPRNRNGQVCLAKALSSQCSAQKCNASDCFWLPLFFPGFLWLARSSACSSPFSKQGTMKSNVFVYQNFIPFLSYSPEIIPRLPWFVKLSWLIPTEPNFISKWYCKHSVRRHTNTWLVIILTPYFCKIRPCKNVKFYGSTSLYLRRITNYLRTWLRKLSRTFSFS